MPPKRYNFRARKTPVVWVDDDTLKTKKEEEDQSGRQNSHGTEVTHSGAKLF